MTSFFGAGVSNTLAVNVGVITGGVELASIVADVCYGCIICVSGTSTFDVANKSMAVAGGFPPIPWTVA